MNRITKTLVASSLFLVPLVLASNVLAQEYTYNSTSDDAAGVFAGGLGLAILCCVTILGLASLGLTIWMSIDAMQRDEKVLPGKVKWLLLIILSFLLTGLPIGAVMYYFMRKGSLDSMTKKV